MKHFISFFHLCMQPLMWFPIILTSRIICSFLLLYMFCHVWFHSTSSDYIWYSSVIIIKNKRFYLKFSLPQMYRILCIHILSYFLHKNVKTLELLFTLYSDYCTHLCCFYLNDSVVHSTAFYISGLLTRNSDLNPLLYLRGKTSQVYGYGLVISRQLPSVLNMCSWILWQHSCEFNPAVRQCVLRLSGNRRTITEKYYKQ